MQHILYKISSPGWVKVFDSEYDARMELLKYICSACMKGEKEFGDKPLSPNDSIDTLLCCPCGCEFDYEEKGNDIG